MLSKDYRLRDDKSIARALRTGRRFNHPAFSFVAAKTTTNQTRLTVVVGKTIDKRAVVRNRLKRRMREALRPLTPRLAQGFDIVVFPRAAVADMVFADLKGAVEDAFKRAGLLV